MSKPITPGMSSILPEPSGASSHRSEPLPKISFLTLLAGLPAVLAATVGVALFLGQGRPISASVYKDEADRRLKKEDLKGALDCYKRMLDQNPNQPDLIYWMALILERTGQGDRAASMIESLAPTDRTGLPIAHFWVANRIIGNPAQLTPARAQQAEGHLLRYLQAKRTPRPRDSSVSSSPRRDATPRLDRFWNRSPGRTRSTSFDWPRSALRWETPSTRNRPRRRASTPSVSWPKRGPTTATSACSGLSPRTSSKSTRRHATSSPKGSC